MRVCTYVYKLPHIYAALHVMRRFLITRTASDGQRHFAVHPTCCHTEPVQYGCPFVQQRQTRAYARCMHYCDMSVCCNHKQRGVDCNLPPSFDSYSQPWACARDLAHTDGDFAAALSARGAVARCVGNRVARCGGAIGWMVRPSRNSQSVNIQIRSRGMQLPLNAIQFWGADFS